LANAASVNSDLVALLRARNTLIGIRSDDEMRSEGAIIDSCEKAKFPVFFWDCATGLTDSAGAAVVQALNDPGAIIGYIRTKRTRAVYVLRDLHKWFDPVVLRGLRSLARELQIAATNEARSLILLSPMDMEVPRGVPELTLVDYPLPDRVEVSRILDDVIRALPDSMRETATSSTTRDRAIDGALGLSAYQISNSYSRSLVTSKTIDPALVASEKKRVIAGIPGITYLDPHPAGLDGIGGYDVLKQWAVDHKVGFSQRAREFGLPAPKGVMLVGPPGTGKSLAAKCFATAFGMPLLRLDMGGTKSKYVGDSEANIRRVLALAETVAPCVLWVDEIEKALGGASGPQGDGGVSADALGTLLSWMQEKTAPVFVVATANDVRALPPELLRKGRFDELFFMDLPNRDERAKIMAASLVLFKRDVSGIDLNACASATDGFVGAEIAALVPDALFVAFADNERALSTDDLTKAAASVVPLSKTASERITALRDWAKGRARPASTAETANANTVRSLDL